MVQTIKLFSVHSFRKYCYNFSLEVDLFIGLRGVRFLTGQSGF